MPLSFATQGSTVRKTSAAPSCEGGTAWPPKSRPRLGSRAAQWSPDDIQRIDSGLAGAMTDAHLNNVLAQYYKDGRPTSAFKPSRVLEGPVPSRVFRDTIEAFVADLDAKNGLSGFDLSSTVFSFLLPRGVVLVDGDKGAHQERHDDADDDSPNLSLRERDEASDSKHGLG